MIKLNEQKRKEEIKERLKNKMIKLDQGAIKIAADNFMQALEYWKSEEKVRKVALIYRPEWGEKEIFSSMEWIKSYVDPVIKVYQPVYDAALNYEIDQPFDFSGYIHSFFTGFYWSELDYPEINDPLYRLSELLRGGLTQEEFWETDYYKKHLLPKGISKRIEVLKQEGKY